MDKQSIIQYKSAFDTIATYIESDNGDEKVEVWFARELRRSWDMPAHLQSSVSDMM